MRSFLKSIGTLIAEDGEDVRGTSKLLYLVWFIEGFMSRLKVFHKQLDRKGFFSILLWSPCMTGSPQSGLTHHFPTSYYTYQAHK